MTKDKHIIKRAIVEVYVTSEKDAFKIQSQASAFFKEKILPLIEKIIEELDVSEDVIRIDKLELDIKKFAPDQFDDSMMRDMEQQIRDKFIKIIRESEQREPDVEARSLVRKGSRKEADEELFIYLLRSGTLPWWAKTEDSVSLKALAQQIFLKPSETFKQQLLNSLQLPAARKRIVYKLDAADVEKLLELVGHNVKIIEVLRSLVEVLKTQDATTLSDITRVMYEHVLTYRALSEINIKFFLSEMLKGNRKLDVAEVFYRASSIQTKKQSSERIQNEIKEALADVDKHFEGRIKRMFSVSDVKQFFSVQERKERKIVKKEIESQKEQISHEEDHFVHETSGDYFIKNAGFILLAPFLPAYFKELDLTGEKGFLSPEKAERAVYLLQYLSAGTEDNFEEHEMVLNKILCGIDVEQPVILDFKITEKEKEESLNLLNAVAGHWTALKGTSGLSMREAFFKRDGILEHQSNGWNLKIEKATIDILLDKLPWTISILQMPWDEKMIFVEW